MLGDKEEGEEPFDVGLVILEDGGFELWTMVKLSSELFRISTEALEEAELVLSELGVDGLEDELEVRMAGSSASGELSILFILGIGVRG